MPIIVPDDNIIKAFSSVLRPIFEEKEKLFNENQYLVMLRDELLPMLNADEWSAEYKGIDYELV